VNPSVKRPTQESGAAIDIYMPASLTLLPRETGVIGTGLSFGWPRGVCGLLAMRGSVLRRGKLRLVQPVVCECLSLSLSLCRRTDSRSFFTAHFNRGGSLRILVENASALSKITLNAGECYFRLVPLLCSTAPLTVVTNEEELFEEGVSKRSKRPLDVAVAVLDSSKEEDAEEEDMASQKGARPENDDDDDYPCSQVPEEEEEEELEVAKTPADSPPPTPPGEPEEEPTATSTAKKLKKGRRTEGEGYETDG
jgi:hypothetical protein